MLTRRLGRSGIEVSAIGMGCWAIGGPWTFNGEPAGWGQVDDAESVRAIHRALDLGVTFFDTAANYGCGHSERLLGQAIAGRRDKVIVATKFGYRVDEEQRQVIDSNDVVGNVHQDCEASLRRIDTNYIDLYQFHVNRYNPAKADDVRDALEQLVDEGKIRWYGWSTDNPEGARVFAQGKHCTAIQHVLNMTSDAPQILAICDEFDLASVNRTPLGMGMLAGKFKSDTTFPADDVRSDWNLKDDYFAERFAQLEVGQALLTSGGRTYVQTALAWIWARSERAVPIPGFKTVTQVEENINAMQFGPLGAEKLTGIDELLGRPPMYLNQTAPTECATRAAYILQAR